MLAVAVLARFVDACRERAERLEGYGHQEHRQLPVVRGVTCRVPRASMLPARCVVKLFVLQSACYWNRDGQKWLYSHVRLVLGVMSG